MTKRLALLLVLVLMLGLMPISAMASEQEVFTVPEQTPYRMNPLYADGYSAGNFILTEVPSASMEADQLGATYLTVDEAAKQLRSYMVSRTASFTLYVKDSSSDYEAVADRMMAKALEHTGSPKEGDYLLWQAEGWSGQVSSSSANGQYNYTYTITMSYYTTASQEQEVNTAVNSLLNTLKVSGKSDYEKVRAVYDYLCKNVKCVAYAQSNTLNHTAYGALVKKSADSQGIASALYRMLLELKVDCRVIAGETDAGVQLWNIAKLGNVYYNLDAAMDAGAGTYKYFLRNSENFADHYRYLDYMTTQFHTDYPMSATDYKDGVAGEPEYYYVMGVCGDDAYWAIDRDRNLTIAGTGGTYGFAPSGDNIAPWVYWTDGFKKVLIEEGITSIGGYAFYEMDNITSYTFAKSLETIGSYAFAGCDGLTKVQIPSTIKTVGDSAFHGCNSLTDVILSNSGDTTYDMSVFSQCTALKNVQIPEGVTNLGGRMFFGCSALTSVKIPTTLTSCDREVFLECKKINSVELPEGLTILGESMFRYCSGLKSITLPSTLTNCGKYVFEDCHNLIDITLPEGLTTLGAYMFSNCDRLERVTLPTTLTEIGESAFSRCNVLAEITLPEGMTVLGKGMFRESGALTTVKLPSTVTEIGESLFAGCPELKSAVIPESVTTLSAFMFENCTSLTELPLHGKLTDIGTGVFSGCTGLKELKFPAGYQIIGNQMFSGCTGLTKVALPDSVTHIGVRAFSNCTGITQLQLSDKLTQIGEGAFAGCTGLTEVRIPNNMTTVSASLFQDCANIKKVVLHNGITAIGDSAFSGCAALQAVELPDSLTTLGGNAFANCSGLTEITVPRNVSAMGSGCFAYCDNLERAVMNNSCIGAHAFQYCQKLQHVEVTGALKEINGGAFYECVKLREFTIPAGVTVEGASLFYNCSGLESVTLNYSGTVGSYMFNQCKNLKNVKLGGDITVIDVMAFSGCSSLTEITIPRSVERLGVSCFEGCTGLGEIRFEGEAPEFQDNCFSMVTATAYYPGDLSSWNAGVMKDYGGDITWVSSHTHTYSSVVTPPTCTEQGYTTHTCSSCGEVTVDTYVAALGHDYAAPEFREDEKAHDYECTRCGDVKTESCTFDDGTVVEEATMDKYGSKKYTCTACGGSYRGEYVYRIYGDNRCATAYAAADMLKDVLGISKFDAIIIASGDNFADALAGSYLASEKGAPILLYRSGFADDNLDYIQKNLASGGTVYILGGTAAVPQEMEDVLKNADISVKRLFGNSRFATNLEILEEAGVEGKEILIATGWEFADSLSASATGLPILMVNNKSGELTEEQAAFLQENRGSSYTIIGGTAAVSEALETAIEDVIGKKVDRVYGDSREATSVKVAERYFADVSCVLLAYSRNFPDGLCGGPLAHALGAPLLLVNSGKEADAAEYVDDNGIGKGAILGGTAVVTDRTGRIVLGLE